MKLIGIVGRAYYNKDNQKITQVNDAMRKTFSLYENVVTISILPTNQESYVDIKMGHDRLDETDKEKLDYILNMCDGFVIPGGTFWYKLDEYVIEYAIQNKKPLLAICLGFQALCNMHAQNRIKFDMTKKLKDNHHYGKENQYIHQNIINDGTLLKDIIGKDIIPVNSIHHDYVDFPMKDLIVSSTSTDGIIEAVELPNHKFLLGLQWHPEYLMDENSKKIFNSFVNSL